MKTQILLIFLLAPGWIFSQSLMPPYPEFSPSAERVPGGRGVAIHIRKSPAPVKTDGLLDEPAWNTAQVAVAFQKQFPVDTGRSRIQTEVRLTFDERHLHVGVLCRQPRSEYTVGSLKRDFAAGTGDAFSVLFDPFKDGLNGFLFSLSPLNVQGEALIDNGANTAYDWDNKWHSAVRNYDDHWTAEIAIPFKTLRYKSLPGENSWRVNFVLTVLNNWETSTWMPIPQQYQPSSLAFAGDLVWDEPPPQPGASISLIPYATARHAIDYRRDPNTLELVDKSSQSKFNFGGDAKIGITPSLNLDLTFNPDFSQVEVDRQVANLSRFELFFPERRQFFLENRDLFAMFGFPNTRPFFSRRIGLADNPVTGQTETVPILAGARLSGKINDEWRIGLLNMQTKRINWDSGAALPAANFTVATAQKKVFKRSALGAILVNKENFMGDFSDTLRAGRQPWNRVAGLEFNLFSPDNRWEGEWYYHRSFSPDPKQRGQTLAHFLGFFDRHFNALLGYVLVDSNYTAEAGFVPRNGFQSFFPGGGITFYPQTNFINTWGFKLNGDLTYALDFRETDRDVSLGVNVNLKDQTSLSLSLWNIYTYLFEPFDPTNRYKAGTTPLPGDRGYAYSGARLQFTSSSSYNFQASLNVQAGQFFNGSRFGVEGNFAYRWQPVGTFTLSYIYNDIRLPNPYPSARFWLLGPRAEVSFSRKFFASAFFQWNTQTNNFNINARFQWRFAPVSDLFLVYTDNSFAEAVPNTEARFLAPKNRTIVLKAVYWLNI